MSASCADRYLSDVWHAAPNFGLITEGIPEARRVGDGWLHCASLNAASVHAVISSAISDGIDSQLRFCARSLLSLTCFLWGSFGAHPAEWSWGHLDELLASGDAALGSSPVGRIFPIEVYMKHVALLRRLATLSDPDRAPSFNFTIEHKPPAGDPFDRSAVIYSPLSHDTLRLFEGDLISDATCLRLGQKRRPVWLLLSAGIVVRARMYAAATAPNTLRWRRCGRPGAIGVFPFLRRGDIASLHALNKSVEGVARARRRVAVACARRRPRLASRTRLGGALATDDLIGGARDNYDAELAHRVGALAVLAGKRVLYIFDSTSPILAGKHFRRSTLSVRSRALCDDWQGWAMAHEQRLESITYWWSHSHCGHLPEAAVDALAKEFLRGDPVPLPSAHCHGRRPAAYRTFTGATLMSLSTPEAETAALAHVLGIVREPTNWFRPTSKLARPLLLLSLHGRSRGQGICLHAPHCCLRQPTPDPSSPCYRMATVLHVDSPQARGPTVPLLRHLRVASAGRSCPEVSTPNRRHRSRPRRQEKGRAASQWPGSHLEPAHPYLSHPRRGEPHEQYRLPRLL